MNQRLVIAQIKFTALIAVILALCCCGMRSMVGKSCPELTVQYLNHKDDAPPRLLGKVYVVEFWATWCPPCRQSIPHLNKLWEKYHDDGFEVIGISQEQTKEIEDFFGKTPIKYYAAQDPDGSLHDKFNIRGIPHAFLVDKNGIVVWDGHPMALQEADINKALKGN